jgi:DNA-binding CsgD family transcriptional regulator
VDAVIAELADLYRLAASASVDEFPRAVIHRLGSWIDFDGAVFGFGEAEARSLHIGTAIVHQRDPSILADYAPLSQEDPVTAAFLRRPARPIVVDARAMYAGIEHGAVRDFAARHELRHLLLFGDAVTREGPLRWVVLYRAKDRAFENTTSERLWGIWQHISCSLDLNRAEALRRANPRQDGTHLALVDARGTLEAVDPEFRSILRLEWPQFDSARLPTPVIRDMARGSTFQGRAIELEFRALGTRVVCRGRRRGPTAGLSPRERIVASGFAAGRTHKEIASELGVSPHTVRAQLAQVYRKLGVSDKAMLAQRLRRE